MKKILFTLSIFLILSAQEIEEINMEEVWETPTPTEIVKVYNYMMYGKEGAILYDSRVTSKIVEGNPTDTLTTIKVGQEILVWLNFLLPANHVDENYTITIYRGPIADFANKPTIRRENNKGALFYRIVRKFRPDRPGTYSVKIFRADLMIREHKFTVM
jgi:hypothetical protein